MLVFQLPSFAASTLAAVLFAWAASRFFIEGRRTGELELLMTTPLGAERIVSDQWNALKHLVRWPMVVMFAPIVLQLARMVASGSPPAQWRVHITISSLLNMVNTFVGLGAVCWLGLWFGLKTAGTAAAIIRTVALAKGVPYIIQWFSPWFFMMLIRPLTGSSFGWTWVAYWLPQLVILLFYFWVIGWAKRRLLHELPGAEPASFNLRHPLSRS